jgi:shikimate dehydrogenase
MVYRPLRTRLIKEAEEIGCRTLLGIEMLIHQAALQFETWTGVGAPVDVMRNAVFSKWASAG